MTRSPLRVLAAALLLVSPSPPWAFEISTHAAITQHAFSKFTSDLPGRMDDLGVYSFLSNPGSQTIFGVGYYDVSGSDVKLRQNSAFENAVIDRLGGEPLGIDGWLMRGAIREDDGVNPLTLIDDFDPYPFPPIRVANHFYDPRKDRGFDVDIFGPHAKSPNWATGAVDVFADPNARDTNRRNHFTVFDAREAMFRALTLKTSDGAGNWVDLPSSGTPGQRLTDRQTYWATVFRALGDVLHLNQDMAQPQHTRDEAHSGLFVIGLGHESFIERYFDTKALGTTTFTIDLLQVTTATATPLHFGVCDAQDQNCVDYPLDMSKFTTYSDFWTTSRGSVGGIGLADYTNPGFFTPLKNLGVSQNDYDLPPNDPSATNYTFVDVTPTTWDGKPITGGSPIHLLLRDVADYLNPSQRGLAVPLTSNSMWDEFMKQDNGPSTYHLVRENYDAMEKLVIPRAVGYSAGLLKFFFRGSMQISLPDEGVFSVVDHSTVTNVDPLMDFKGFGTIRLKLKNTSPPLAQQSDPEAMSGGTLFAVLKFHRNNCYKDDLTGQPGAPSVNPLTCRTSIEETVVSDAVPQVTLSSTDKPFTFKFSAGQLPINATDVYLQVVYRGALGGESDAVVVATQDISEPTFYAYINAADYIHLGASVYTRDAINADPNLIAAIRPVQCVDFTQNPAQLKSGPGDCFTQDPETRTFSAGSVPTQIKISNLPVQHFVRFAFLSVANVETGILEAGNCVPNGPVDVTPGQWQNTFDPASEVLRVAYLTLLPVRGIYGNIASACVLDGDDSAPGTPDDRNTKMPVLIPANMTPNALTITPAP